MKLKYIYIYNSNNSFHLFIEFLKSKNKTHGSVKKLSWLYQVSVKALPGVSHGSARSLHGSERSLSGCNIASRIISQIPPRAKKACSQSHPPSQTSLRAMTDSWQSHDGLLAEPGVLFLYFKNSNNKVRIKSKYFWQNNNTKNCVSKPYAKVDL